MTLKYRILHPPPGVELPARSELLKQKPGNSVKLVFQVGNEIPERMWVTVTDCSNPAEWKGVVDNDATQPKTLAVLPAGTEVLFLPSDIIEIYT